MGSRQRRSRPMRLFRSKRWWSFRFLEFPWTLVARDRLQCPIHRQRSLHWQFLDAHFLFGGPTLSTSAAMATRISQAPSLCPDSFGRCARWRGSRWRWRFIFRLCHAHRRRSGRSPQPTLRSSRCSARLLPDHLRQRHQRPPEQFPHRHRNRLPLVPSEITHLHNSHRSAPSATRA
jgi:hypothetical protein